ncbi:hypothetical protein F3Y22_tig00110840pilonHSYRG00031 [Hibiscus syriacus]|uniref:Transmembrane protein n=1 Tax=Hibiscus syriacus TaxID=106335 RepID=A0A6A2ZJT9_HIBSY|nr:hypothetical protein F3Y22_tig00110840pilonHSYRG00031 [Hibiscus syriacus]
MARQIGFLFLLLSIAFVALVSAEDKASPTSSQRGIPMPSHDHDVIGNSGDEGAPSGGPVGAGDIVAGPLGSGSHSSPSEAPTGRATITQGGFSAVCGAISVVVGYFFF